jgi:hypothetical protein
MSITPDDARDLTSMPTGLLAARMREAVDELLRRGISIEEQCRRLGLSGPEELSALLNAADLDGRAAR